MMLFRQELTNLIKEKLKLNCVDEKKSKTITIEDNNYVLEYEGSRNAGMNGVERIYALKFYFSRLKNYGEEDIKLSELEENLLEIFRNNLSRLTISRYEFISSSAVEEGERLLYEFKFAIQKTF